MHLLLHDLLCRSRYAAFRPPVLATLDARSWPVVPSSLLMWIKSLYRVQDSEARAAAALTDARTAWEVELKRARAAWAAAERPRREAWAAAKEREVKELTIKACSSGTLTLSLAFVKRGLGGCQGPRGQRDDLKTYNYENCILIYAPRIQCFRGRPLRRTSWPLTMCCEDCPLVLWQTLW